MSPRRIYTGIIVLVGALLAIQIFNSWYESGLIRLVFDLAVFSAAMLVFSKVKPAETVRGELIRLAVGIVLHIAALLIHVSLLNSLMEPMANSFNEGWLLLLRLPQAFSLAWSILAIIRIGENEWARRRRRIVVGVVITVALALLNAPNGVIFVVALFVVLYVVPGRWIDELTGKWGWLILGMLILVPVGAMVFLVDVQSDLPSEIESLAPRVTSLVAIIDSSLFSVIQSYFGVFWLLFPLRFIVAVFQGTFGIRVPIWLKLSSNYIFSTVIPGFLLLALLFASIYLGIGSMRAHAVRDLIYMDLAILEEAHKNQNLHLFNESDSLVTGQYFRLIPVIDEERQIAPPSNPGLGEGGTFDGIHLQSDDLQWRWSNSVAELSNEDLEEEIWICLSKDEGSWSLPDTLPLFPGWKDSTKMHHGIVPVGNGRVAYASAIALEAGSPYVSIVLMPLNRLILDKYKNIVQAEINISAYSEFTHGFMEGSSTQSINLGPMWENTQNVKTNPFRQDFASTWKQFIHTPIYHGVCELQVWPGTTENVKQMSGLVSVSTSLSSLFSTLYTTEGLNRITLTLLAVLAGLLGLAVIFSSILGFGINRTITSSISALRLGTEQLRKGNLDTTIVVKNRDELGDLADSFNQMTADLRRMLIDVAEKERLEQEIQIARQIQLHLLPAQLPVHPPLMIGAKSEPALEVGGDYYDAIDLGERGILMAIGDVSGKGVGAAILMSNLQANLHILSGQDLTLDAIVTQLNNHIFRNSTSEMFITFFIALFDPKNMQLTYINAGHDTPAIIKDSSIINLDKGGLLLGIMPEISYESEQITLEPGDILACYSDGLTEAMDEDGEEFGRDRLIATITDLYQNRLENDSNVIVDEVIHSVRRYAGDERAGQDDLTLLIAKVDSYNLEL